MLIEIFVTGGTFDKEYQELEGRLFFRQTHVPEMLRLGRDVQPGQRDLFCAKPFAWGLYRHERQMLLVEQRA